MPGGSGERVYQRRLKKRAKPFEGTRIGAHNEFYTHFVIVTVENTLVYKTDTDMWLNSYSSASQRVKLHFLASGIVLYHHINVVCSREGPVIDLVHCVRIPPYRFNQTCLLQF